MIEAIHDVYGSDMCGDSVIGSEVRLNSGIVDRTASLAQSDL